MADRNSSSYSRSHDLLVLQVPLDQFLGGGLPACPFALPGALFPIGFPSSAMRGSLPSSILLT